MVALGIGFWSLLYILGEYSWRQCSIDCALHTLVSSHKKKTHPYCTSICFPKTAGGRLPSHFPVFPGSTSAPICMLTKKLKKNLARRPKKGAADLTLDLSMYDDTYPLPPLPPLLARFTHHFGEGAASCANKTYPYSTHASDPPRGSSRLGPACAGGHLAGGQSARLALYVVVHPPCASPW